MRRRSLRTFVQILLVGLLLGASSSAYADAISTTSVSLTNLQIVPTSGTIVFSTPKTIAGAAAALNRFDEESGDSSESPTRAEASASVNFASANAVSDFTNLFLNANTNVMLSGCCSANTEAAAVLRQNFMIVGGSGNVDVTFSALMQTMQNLLTDQLGLSATSIATLTLQVLDPVSFASISSFSFDSNLRIGANDSTALEMQRQLSHIVTLQFDQEYHLFIHLHATSRGAQEPIPEPATMVLLVSGLGFMAGFVKKRRMRKERL